MNKNMKFVRKKVSDLIRPDFNPRVDVRENKKLYEQLSKSIDAFGYVSPVIWNKRTGNVVGGNQRLAVLQDKGIKEIDVVEVNLPLKKEKSLNVALNKITGLWDDKKLASLLQEIKEEDLDVLTGFDVDEIDQLMIETGLITPELEKTDVNFLIDADSKYKIKPGEIFQLGNHRLMCGDSTKKDDVKSCVYVNLIDLVITDPPYNVNYSSKNDLLNLYGKGNAVQTPLKNDFSTEQEYLKFTELWMNNTLNVLNDYNSIYVFGNYESLIQHYFIEEVIVSNMLVWAKNSIVLGRMDYKCQHEFILYGWKKHHKWYGKNNASTVLEFNKPLSNKLHPTMKPIELLQVLINNSSKPKMNIFDPFGGSGSTLIACEQTNRFCYMMEIDPHYCSVIIERWEKFTNKNHIKL